MSQTKHNPPQKSEPSFIKFSNVQVGFLKEIRNRQLREFNEAIDSVYEELGIIEKLLKAPPGKYKLRQDLTGLDVLPIKPEPEIEKESTGEKSH